MNNTTNHAIYITTSELLERYSITKVTLCRWKREENFPKPAVARRGRGQCQYFRKQVEIWENSNERLKDSGLPPLLPNAS